MPLNPTQKALIECTCKIYFEIIKECRPDIACYALKAIFDDDIYQHIKTHPEFKEFDLLGTIDFFRRIINHLHPQNRSESYPYIGQEPGQVMFAIREADISSREIKDEKTTQIKLINGTIITQDMIISDKTNHPQYKNPPPDMLTVFAREPEGLLGLSAKGPITKEELVKYLKELCQAEEKEMDEKLIEVFKKKPADIVAPFGQRDVKPAFTDVSLAVKPGVWRRIIEDAVDKDFSRLLLGTSDKDINQLKLKYDGHYCGEIFFAMLYKYISDLVDFFDHGLDKQEVSQFDLKEYKRRFKILGQEDLFNYLYHSKVFYLGYHILARSYNFASKPRDCLDELPKLKSSCEKLGELKEFERIVSLDENDAKNEYEKICTKKEEQKQLNIAHEPFKTINRKKLEQFHAYYSAYNDYREKNVEMKIKFDSNLHDLTHFDLLVKKHSHQYVDQKMKEGALADKKSDVVLPELPIYGMKRVIKAVEQEMKNFIIGRSKGFSTFRMGRKEFFLRQAFNRAEGNLEKFKSIDEFINFKKNQLPSIKEALNNPRKWPGCTPLWGETDSWRRVRMVIEQIANIEQAANKANFKPKI